MCDSPEITPYVGADSGIGFRSVETMASQILEALPGATYERTRDVVQINSGDSRGVVIVVTPEAVEFRLPTVDWTHGSYGPAASSRLWKRVRHQKLTRPRLKKLLEAAQQERAAEFEDCPYCGKRFPKEHRTGAACHGCASEHLGIVY